MDAKPSSIPRWVERESQYPCEHSTCDFPDDYRCLVIDALAVAIEALKFTSLYSNDPAICVEVHKVLRQIEAMGEK